MNKTWKIIIAIVGALLCVDIAIRVFDNKESSAEKTNAPISLEGKSVQETYGTLPVAEVTSLESSATEKSTSVIDNTSNEVFSTATFTVEIPTTVAPIKSETTTTPMTIAPTQPETTGAPTTIAPTEPETTAAPTTAAPTEPPTEPMVPDPNTCDHSYQLEYEFPPTATSTGEKCYRCSKCGHVYREIIEKLPHDHEWTQYTIFSNGFKYPTGTIITYSAFICDTCGACYKADENNRYVKTDEFNAHLATHGEDAPWHSGFSTMPCEDFYSDLEQSTDYFCRICGAKKP